MRFFCFAGLLASAAAFTSQPAITTNVPVVGDVVSTPNTAHRNRRATIVMDGKANGEYCSLAIHIFWPHRSLEFMHPGES